MINSRSQGGVGPDVSADGMTYWVSDKQPLTDNLSDDFWTIRLVH